jgi:mRNA interferase HigB
MRYSLLMRIVSEKQLRQFTDKHPAAKASMKDWIKVVRRADWKDTSDVRATFNSADFYCECVIFNVGGNNFRIIAKVKYKIKIVFIRFVLTHPEYDQKKWQKDCI